MRGDRCHPFFISWEIPRISYYIKCFARMSTRTIKKDLNRVVGDMSMSRLWEVCNIYLAEGTEESYLALRTLLNAKENEAEIQESNELIVMWVASAIWALEQQIYGKTTIYVGCTCVEEVVQKYQYAKFVFRRIEQLLSGDICIQGIRELLQMEMSMASFFYIIKKEVRKSYQTMLLCAAYLESLGEKVRRDELLQWVQSSEFVEYEKESLEVAQAEQVPEMLYNEESQEEKAEYVGDSIKVAQENKNEHKFCFIVCTNNQLFLEECFLYISQLILPSGYEIETLTVWEAESMCAGYNEGMEASDALYKIYLHQDVFITNKYFLYDILKVYNADAAIGLIGMVGCEALPDSGVMWETKRIGSLYNAANVDTTVMENAIVPLEYGYKIVEAVDGLIMITNRDIPFRADLFDGWDFYDASACMEFRKRGYKVVVAGQKEPWCIHDCGKANLNDYERNRKIFVSEYFAK